MDNRVDLQFPSDLGDTSDWQQESCIDWANAPGGERECEEDYPCKMHDQRPKFWSAAIYKEWLDYGGAEEGGWWYDVGTPVTHNADLAVLTRFFKSSKEAYEYGRDVLTPVVDAANEGRLPKSSVISDGVYTWNVQRGYPADYPERRPHYE